MNRNPEIVRIGSVIERPYSLPVRAEIGQAAVAIRPMVITAPGPTPPSLVTAGRAFQKPPAANRDEGYNQHPWVHAQEAIQRRRLAVDLNHSTPKGILHRLEHAVIRYGDPKHKAEQCNDRTHHPLT